ncbi:MAG: 1-deoxy-D-xylulose-5-phosphate synthase [Lachnospiraceae bacterium]|nr:1-deoxy-D-xylulose-5-phosphate synthase [uncultured Agathobacter sp.]MCI7112838.1 1-deoxy-D-xylulose-5-phosphate synthase [Lachnobacterium sp.]MDD6137919.1 1-deoxy-D-xylulose-5-phosphate synthase [Lachnospiraceae bacterium]MDY6155043.1 1-deoxy-D-xylulose-5-phosphate synthase [Agathobacter sp.]MEE1033238.1 1-deoxy-D-xylulose-5-phosphate synthase [Agathobacter sp.]
MVLDKIKKANDIKKLSPQEVDILRDEIREFLIDSISVTGGHLASNLGVVELTMALHLSLDLPTDKIVWDVGHQSYTHKILTGRKDGFASLRKFGGMSGFPKTDESDCDCFNTGHSSTSISAGLGLAMARQITGDDYHVVSVIGDGALTGGMAYEALNNASSIESNFIIVLNDNNMSISENVGGVSHYLSGFRTADAYRDLKNNVMNSLNQIPVYGERMVKRIRNTKSSIKQLFIPGMFFEEMGIIYLGPVDGSDIGEMCRIFEEAKRVDGPVLVHVITKKGAGYLPAEKFPSRFHGAEPFDIATGLPKNKRTKANYTDVFSTVMVKAGERNEKLVAITAAMADGTGLRRYRRCYPKRFFDVGIAEGHAVTFAAGLAKAGLIPVFAVYSSFLQRGFDQIIHDVCIQNLHVIFAIDRAGLVGSDGETHQGIFDISYLSQIPNMTVLAPKNKWELSDMMKFAIDFDGPIAIRYPRGLAYDGLKEYRSPIRFAKSETIFKGTDVAILALGSMVKTAETVCRILKEHGITATLINARFAKPFDGEVIKSLTAYHHTIVTMEENVKSAGFGEHVAEYLEDNGIDLKLINISIPDAYVEHGNVDKLKEMLKIDALSVADRIINEVL